MRTRKGRGGKVVTLIEGLVLAASEREALARELRRACGVGGTVRGDAIELQGDLRERLAELLTERGYLVKLVGG
ncbi:MAG: translation initiation factor [Chloroflexi bacterium]|nr:translation initiation factor [Chloroflexota bacterium]